MPESGVVSPNGICSNNDAEVFKVGHCEYASTVAAAKPLSAAVPLSLENVLDAVVSASNSTTTIASSNSDSELTANAAEVTESVYDFQEEERAEDRVLRRKPKRQAHEKLKDRWMREEQIRRQQEERQAAFERQLHHQERQRRKRKRFCADKSLPDQVVEVHNETVSDEHKDSFTPLPLIAALPGESGESPVRSVPQPLITSTASDNTALPSPSHDESPVSIKIKINRVPQTSGSYQVRLVDGLFSGSDASPTASSSATAGLSPTKESCRPEQKRRGNSRGRGQRSTDTGCTKQRTVKASRKRRTASPSTAGATEKKVRSCPVNGGGRLRIGDVVWAKISGWPWWPSQVLNLQPVTTDEHFVACVQWYNWDQISYLPVDKLHSFLDDFKVKFNKRKKGAYKTAVEQAWAAAQAVRAGYSDDTDEEDKAVVADLEEQLKMENTVTSEVETMVQRADNDALLKLPSRLTDEVEKGAVKERRRSSSSVVDVQSAGTDEEQRQQNFDSLHIDSGGALLNSLPDLGANLGRELGQIAAVDIPTFSDDDDDYERRLIIDTDADRIMDRIDS